MTFTTLLSELQKRNVRLACEGDRLRWKAPKGALSEELRAALQEHKSALLAELLESQTPLLVRAPQLPTSWCGKSGGSDEWAGRIERFRSLVEAAEAGQLPSGPIAIAPGVTVTDGNRFVLASWDVLSRFSALAQTKTLHPTTAAMSEGCCERLEAFEHWCEMAKEAKP